MLNEWGHPKSSIWADLESGTLKDEDDLVITVVIKDQALQITYGHVWQEYLESEEWGDLSATQAAKMTSATNTKVKGKAKGGKASGGAGMASR